jgi:holo-[acyl-carrier protein] synthase
VIIGIGVDLVDVRRFAAACLRTPGLVERCFTVAERAGPGRRLAGGFAAKEAVAKALGAPPGLHWQDAEVVRTEGGCPELMVRGTVAVAADAAGVRRWHLSLSHDGSMVVALVVAES